MNMTQSNQSINTTQNVTLQSNTNISDTQILEIPDEVWPQIEQIQEVAYRDDLAEDIDILKIKSDVSPETCFVCMDDDEQVLGYVLAHPWESEEPPHINQDISDRKEVVSVEDASTLYIHDLAINPDARGAGIAQALIENLLMHADALNINRISLVAVQGMASFWAKYGFKSVKSDCTDSYGDDAQLMVNQL
ncbi:GNAT family N-acetyltransferase [Vibrio sp. S17_S38]|uniref:GNAT family N-acetyltransferase n=1 Tax=Vibrio sp. S17_S38 TaxID=2720229 RepID=UPI001681AEDB|nr:GNAT family N-acetyltransferase [Vibrio sp. S17_S38]MBD1573499.1 GNAT family N-acetyltransferase [Vibrio sp. S17_S38]